MILRPVLGASLRQILCCPLKQTRSLRPSIKIGKEQFQLSLDVHQYNKDEIRVKAHPEFVVIEGKQEKSTQQGYILRQFIRKFKLPEGCIPSKMESKISPDGILTITAPRSFSASNLPTETVIVPISYGPNDKRKKVDTIEEPPKVFKNPCDSYPKVKPED